MELKNRIEEFHSGSKPPKLIRINSQIDWKTKSTYTKKCSEDEVSNQTNPKKLLLTPSKTTKFKSFEETTFVYKNKNSEEKKEVDLSGDFQKALSTSEVSHHITLFRMDKEAPKKSSFAAEIENKENEERLKGILQDSLSPSPFENENWVKEEETLNELISSAETTAKNILFSSFYQYELGGGSSHHSWKKALKQHIVQTLESICILKKLKEIPLAEIEKKLVSPSKMAGNYYSSN